MTIQFAKYQGAGNDFIVIDNRLQLLTDQNLTPKVVEFLCDRRFGIGADGLMLLELAEGFDFRMRYFNSDGFEATMCGNGGRCISAFALRLSHIKLTGNEAYTQFIASDGRHEAYISEGNPATVKLRMTDVVKIETHNGFYFINTGSPHYVEFRNDLETIDVYSEGKKIRYDKRFENGTNVNFAQWSGKGISLRTYERGVENETLACGTGSVATAIAAFLQQQSEEEIAEQQSYTIHTRGGNLMVSFEKKGDKMINVWLQGAATFVFDGSITI